jgi:hypothetical protein
MRLTAGKKSLFETQIHPSIRNGIEAQLIAELD